MHLPRLYPCIYVLIGGFLFFAPKGYAQTFMKYEIHMPHPADPYVLVDLNEDKALDLLVPVPGSEQKSAALMFYLWSGHGYPEKPTFEVPLMSDVALFDVGNVDKKSGQEIVLLRSDGVYTVSKDQVDKPEKVFATNSIFSGVRKIEQPKFWDFAIDLDQDDRSELLIPHFDRIGVYGPNASGSENDTTAFTERFALPKGVEASIQRLDSIAGNMTGVSYATHNLSAFDLNHDGRKDLLLNFDDKLSLFLNLTSGGFAVQNVKLPMIEKNHDGEINLGDGEEEFERLLHIGDINNDGLIDLVINRTSVKESVFNPQTVLNIYLGKVGPELSFSDKADHVIHSKGTQGPEIRISDIDGDGKMDIGVPTITLGLWKIVKILTSGEAQLTYAVYAMSSGNQSQLFPSEPTFTRDISIEFHLSGDKGVNIPVLDITGDFNHDGLADLLTSEKNRLLVYFQTGNHQFSETPDLTYALTVPKNGSSVRVQDLNGDGRSDILIPYETADAKEDEALKDLLVILLTI